MRFKHFLKPLKLTHKKTRRLKALFSGFAAVSSQFLNKHHKSNCHTKAHCCNSFSGWVPALVLMVSKSGTSAPPPPPFLLVAKKVFLNRQKLNFLTWQSSSTLTETDRNLLTWPCEQLVIGPTCAVPAIFQEYFLVNMEMAVAVASLWFKDTALYYSFKAIQYVIHLR